MSVTDRLFRVGSTTEATQTHSRISLIHFVFLMTFLVVAVVGCTITGTGEAPSPVSSIPLTASDAGLAATSDGPLDPVSCEGVLASPPATHTLELQALTETGQGGSEQIDTMCAAVYQASTPGDPFIAVALIAFDSSAPAVVRYDMLRDVYSSGSYPVSEINNADDGLLDEFSALMDSDGIGRTTVIRHNSWILTISSGPTVAESPWTADDLRIIGRSIIARAQG